jgi:hypothetical protein
MIPRYRKFIPPLFALFCVVIIPVTVFLSSGSLFNLTNNTFGNSLSIKINTVPNWVTSKVNNTELGLFNSEFRVPDNVLSSVSLNKVGFLSENISVIGPTNNNSALVLDPIYLLPTTSTLFDSTLSITQLIDYNLGIGQMNGKNYVFNYDFAGIKSPSLISYSDTTDFTKNIVKLDDRLYYLVGTNKLLRFVNNSYQIDTIDNVPFDIKKIISNMDKSILIMTTNNRLYEYNINSREYSLLSDGVYDMQEFKNTNSSYILTNLGILRVDRGVGLSLDSFQISKIKYKLPDELINNLQCDSVCKVELGIDFLDNSVFLKLGSNLFIYQDSVKDWRLIDSQVHKFYITEGRVFILDKEGFVKVLNVDEQYFSVIDKLDFQPDSNTSIFYSKSWSRIMIYNSTNVYSTPYNLKYIPNLSTSPNVTWNIQRWLSNSRCYSLVADQSQYCIQDSKLRQYKNVNVLNVI